MKISHYYTYKHSTEEPNRINIKINGGYYWDVFKISYIKIFGLRIPFFSMPLRAEEIKQLIKRDKNE